MTDGEKATLAAAGLEIRVVIRGFVLRDTETGLYRSTAPLSSRFAWVKWAEAGAVFETADVAAAVGIAYAEGRDLALTFALPSLKPEKIIYPARQETPGGVVGLS